MSARSISLSAPTSPSHVRHRDQRRSVSTRRVLIPVILSLIGPPLAATAQEKDPDEWRFSLTPYLWLPTIAGDLAYEAPPGGGGSPSFDLGPTDWLDMLNFAALVGGTAKKGRFSIMSDFVYLSMSNEPDSRLASVDAVIPGPGGIIEIPVNVDVTLDTETDLTGFTWNLAFGYELRKTETSNLDAFIGARYFSLDAETSWSLTAAVTTPGGTEVLPAAGAIGSETELWDAIIGVRGKFGLGNSRWSVPYYADVGSGDSDLTWNAFAGLTYAFDWGDLLLAYRHLEYDEGPSGLLQGFSFSGPAFGATFVF